MTRVNFVRDGGAYISQREIDRMISADGLAHVVPMGEEPVMKSKGRHFYEPSPQKAEEIKKCLDCKKKKCTGGWTCFGGDGK